MKNLKIEKTGNSYIDFLSDESKKIGTASSISFPETEDDIKNTMEYLNGKGINVTLQGARTGIAAGAVPPDGHILNLGKMDRVTGMEYDSKSCSFMLHVQPGLTLARLREMLAKKDFDTADWQDESLDALNVFLKSGDWFFPPDPTETSASLGGMAACNSSGARSFYYGPVRKYIEGLDVVLADGSVLRLERGINRADGRDFRIVSNGKVYSGKIPAYKMPDVKNASGYYASEGMDLIDLFIGSEGTLGIISGITIRLLPSPPAAWGIMSFFSSEDPALEYVQDIRRGYQSGTPESIQDKPAAVEFFNNDTLKLLRKTRSENISVSEIPDIPDEYDTAVYTEFHGNSEDIVCDMAMRAMDILGKYGVDDESVWLASNSKEMERLRIFRHAVPEVVNRIIAERKKSNPDITKLGTDMAVPDVRLKEVMNMYNRDIAAAGLQSVIFGHIGNNHVHVNILPRTADEYETGRKLYHGWARTVIGMGGTISAEHGVGKLKTYLLREMYGDEGIRQMQAVKKVFDPEGIINPGNLF